MMRLTDQGYIALIAVLILGAVSLTAGLALLTSGVDNQKMTLTDQQSMQARALADACAEEALQVMHNNTAYTGTAGLSLGQGSCSYTVTNTGGTGRTIATSGSVSSVVRKVIVYATISTSSISITSWQEVSDT